MKKMKYYLAYPYVNYLKSKSKPTFVFDCDSLDLGKRGISILPEAWSKECPRLITSNDITDSLGFCGVRKDGCVFISRITRLSNRTAEVSLYLRLSNGDQYQLPNHPDVYIYNADGRRFTAAGLCFEVIEPLRTWRITFNGFLRKGILSSWDESDDDVVQARFNFLWHPIHGYMGFPEDFNVESMTELLASRKWFSEFGSPYNLFKQEWQEQFGEIHGILNIGNQEVELFFRGLKLRKYGLTCENTINFSFQGVLHNGCTFHLFANCDSVINKFVYGYLCTADSMMILPFSKCNLDLDKLKKEQMFSELFEIKFMAGGKSYKLSGNVEKSSGMSVFPGASWERIRTFQYVRLSMNDASGEGIVEIESANDNHTSCPFVNRCSLPLLEDFNYITICERLVVEFSDDECKSSQIVGGKGMSLALLSSLDSKSRNFSVPNGFCLTKTAFELHLNENTQLLEGIKDLNHVAGYKCYQLEDECRKLSVAVLETSLSTEIKQQIMEKLKLLFGQQFEIMKFAVRSSAIGEDSEELSAAGQNETILGVKGFERICFAVIKCWASQFAFRSVEYKRQNGQLLYGGMGVVIQEMIDAETAGVLFSKDPISGSPESIIINSNYGLGESVVSATIDPDSIVLRRTWNDKVFTTENVVIGTKSTMITMSDSEGIAEVGVDPEKRSKISIDKELSLKLGNIALYLEKCFGSPRDIEWALYNQTVYLLQSRPMTGGSNLIDFEVIHEFDTAMRTDMEHYSTANVGEVMPGAQTPMTLTSVGRSQIPLLQKVMTWRISCHRYDPTIMEIFGFFYGHAMQELIQMKAWGLEKKKSATTKAMELGIYGRILDDEEIVKMAFERFTKPPLKNRMGLANIVVTGIFFGNSMIKEAEKKYGNYPDPTLRGNTIDEIYKLLGEHFIDTKEAMYIHIFTTMASTMWNLLTLNIISIGDSYELDQYSDFALIVGSCIGAESGNVPFSLKELANNIIKEMDTSQFLAMEPEKAIEWLQNEDHETGRMYKRFIERHGHRGLKEFDLSCRSWAIEPIQIITVLQNMLKSPNSFKDSEERSIDDVLRNLKTPLSSTKKRLLKWVMGKCRQGVCNREKTKSIAIKTYEGIRLGLHRLANMMVEGGLLPDSNLIFFFTYDELGRFIKTRSPLLIQRAKQRLRLHSYMDKLEFEEMINGYPIPIDLNKNVELPEDTEGIKGYPVSQGKIEGKARVIISFHEINTIQPGEILITHATDIGWSPYFPMLGGVVTELGGLISHGAVVAREFGLPCIVGAQNATRFFKTGDTVLLDATHGMINRLKASDNS